MHAIVAQSFSMLLSNAICLLEWHAYSNVAKHAVICPSVLKCCGRRVRKAVKQFSLEQHVTAKQLLTHLHSLAMFPQVLQPSRSFKP